MATTRPIELYGVGNALVDKQVKVTDVELEELRLTRGGMQLTSADEQKAILDRIGDRDAELHAGGSAANTIVAFAQMGGRAAYACALGRDEFGEFYRRDFERYGIRLDAAEKHLSPTGTCLILITPDGERTMNTHLGASERLEATEIDSDAISDAEWLYVEGYLLTGPDQRDAAFAALEAARSAGTKVAFTFSDGFVVDSCGDDMRHIVREYADLVFANEREAAVYTGEREPLHALSGIARECTLTCITLGEQGSIICQDGNIWEVPVEPATPVDLTGAGDMFAAGFLFGLIRGLSPARCAKLGSEAARRIVQQMGARLTSGLPELAEGYVKR